jgi:5-methylcytosine-specific restriction endonuclease McrA
MDKIVFFNTGWMKNYKGLPPESDDFIVNGGKFVEEYGYGHEIYNFRKEKGQIYGFVETKSNGGVRNSIHIERIDPKDINLRKDETIDDVLVIWTAKKPTNPKVGDHESGTRIVGWYENATIHRTTQYTINREYNKDKFGFFAEANEDDCVLLPIEERTFEIPRSRSKGYGFGQSLLWYADEGTDEVIEFRKKIVQYINDYNSILSKIKQDTEEIQEETKSIGSKKEKEIEEEIRQLSREEIKKRIDEYTPKTTETTTARVKVYARDLRLSCLLKEYHNNICQACKSTFEKTDKKNYSETHHLIYLHLGGKDISDNIAVLCPTCHKKIHFGSVAIKIEILSKLPQNLAKELIKEIEPRQ